MKNRILRALTVFGAAYLFGSCPLQAETLQETYGKGMAYLQAGEEDKAIEVFEQAIESNPEMPQLYNALGVAYAQKEGGFRNACKAYEEALRLDPTYAEAYFNFGLISIAVAKDTEKAEELFKKAVQFDSKFSKAYASLGWLYLTEKQDLKNAGKSFRRAVRISGQDANALYGLGLVYFLEGKQERVLGPISKLRALNREDLAVTLEGKLSEEKKAEEAPLQEPGMPFPEPDHSEQKEKL